MIAKNPDAIYFSTNLPGDVLLQVQQALELGFKGRLTSSGSTQLLTQELGPEAAEGFIYAEPQFSSPLYPKKAQELYEQFQERYAPEGYQLRQSVRLGYGAVEIFAQAAEEAGSLDVDALDAVFDDPDWEFEYFGFKSRMGGLDTYGIARRAGFPVAFSTIRNGELVELDRTYAILP